MTDTHEMSERAYWQNMAEVSRCLSRNLITQAELVDQIAKGLAQRSGEPDEPIADDDPCAACTAACWAKSVRDPCMYRYKCVPYHQWADGQEPSSPFTLEAVAKMGGKL